MYLSIYIKPIKYFIYNLTIRPVQKL